MIIDLIQRKTILNLKISLGKLLNIEAKENSQSLLPPLRDILHKAPKFPLIELFSPVITIAIASISTFDFGGIFRQDN